jgi:hypothetical protein
VVAAGFGAQQGDSVVGDLFPCRRQSPVWWTGAEAGDRLPMSLVECDCASGLVSSLVISVVVRRPTGWRHTGGQSGFDDLVTRPRLNARAVVGRRRVPRPEAVRDVRRWCQTVLRPLRIFDIRPSSGVVLRRAGPLRRALKGVTRVRVISVRCSRRREVVHAGAESILVDIGQDHRCARLGEGTRRGEPHGRARTRDKRDLAGEVVRRVHGCFPTLDGSRAGGRSASCWRRTRPAQPYPSVEWSLRSWNSSCSPSCISCCRSGSGPGSEPNRWRRVLAMGDREHAPDTRRRLGAGGRSQGPERRVRDAQGVPRRGDRGGRGLHNADRCNGTKESTAAADLDYKTSILAAQILVERPEDRITTTSPPPATRCLMSWKSTVLSSSKQPATGALGRPQTAQVSAKHDQP